VDADGPSAAVDEEAVGMDPRVPEGVMPILSIVGVAEGMFDTGIGAGLVDGGKGPDPNADPGGNPVVDELMLGPPGAGEPDGSTVP
jgi:hypothetical protein